jgi:hypothetical protein
VKILHFKEGKMNIRLLGASTLLAALTLTSTFVGDAGAQITINIPNFPKIKKGPKPTPTPEPVVTTSTTTSSSTDPDNGSSVTRGDESSSTVPAKKGCEDDIVFQVHNENITKTIEQALDYTAGSRDYYVQDFNDNHNEYLKAALSPSKRKEYIDRWKDPVLGKCFNDRLNALEAAAAKTIGSYKPIGYTLGTPAEKAALRAAVTDIAQATVHSVGIKDNTWKIVYNDLGIPRGRKKLGKLWLKYPQNKYCTIVWANVWQPYAGGGTYGASERDFIAWEFAGCPTGK